MNSCNQPLSSSTKVDVVSKIYTEGCDRRCNYLVGEWGAKTAYTNSETWIYKVQSFDEEWTPLPWLGGLITSLDPQKLIGLSQPFRLNTNSAGEVQKLHKLLSPSPPWYLPFLHEYDYLIAHRVSNRAQHFPPTFWPQELVMIDDIIIGR